ncbi:hypothetical protein Tco_1240016 [Tanacetum coccineum]
MLLRREDILLRRTICLNTVSKDQTKSLCSIQAASTQTDCIQDTVQKMKLKRLKASIATMTRQTDAEKGRPTIKKLEVKQVEFKLGEDCWEIQVRSRDRANSECILSYEDANLKFLRSLPSVWHVVATMIRGQPGLDDLEFDDLYNNLKVYEHELKGVSISSSQNIAFLSTEIKGSTLKQSTADSENIPKGYTQAALNKVQTAPNCASHLDEIICSFYACKLMRMLWKKLTFDGRWL